MYTHKSHALVNRILMTPTCLTCSINTSGYVSGSVVLLSVPTSHIFYVFTFNKFTNQVTFVHVIHSPPTGPMINCSHLTATVSMLRGNIPDLSISLCALASQACTYYAFKNRNNYSA